MYTWNQLGIVELTNLYLYGGTTPPADLSSESMIREREKITPILMDAVSFMATGPGRFANGTQITVVDMFMSGRIGSTTGETQVLNLAAAMALTGVGKSNQSSYLASNYVDSSDDHALRTYLYESESFKLADNVTFVIEPDGRRYIQNYAIRPFDDNFDFKSDTGISQWGNERLQPRIDPWGIGRTVSITFDPGSKDSIPAYTYTQAKYNADVQRYADTFSPVSGTARLTYEMPSVIDQLWTSHSTQFIDAERRVIVYGTQDGDQLSAAKINNLPIDSPLRIYYSMNATGVALIGGVGTDTLTGDIGNDLLDGGTGDDRLNGGAGNDTYIYKSGDGKDTITDSDGSGSILVNGAKLPDAGKTDYKLLQNGQGEWRVGGGATVYTLDQRQKQLIVTGSSLGGGQITIDDFDIGKSGGYLGIKLDASQKLALIQGTGKTAGAATTNPYSDKDFNETSLAGKSGSVNEGNGKAFNIYLVFCRRNTLHRFCMVLGTLIPGGERCMYEPMQPSI